MPAPRVTILPVDPPAIAEASASAEPFSAGPAQAPGFQKCECEGSCETTEAFIARISDDKLLACEAAAERLAAADQNSLRGVLLPPGSPAPTEAEARSQRVLDCFLPESGTRLRLCPIFPQNRGELDGYLRSAIRLPRDCFGSAHARGRSPWGATEVPFRIDGGGAIQDVRVDSSDAVLAECVADGMKRASFARFAGDVTRVRYRLVFDMPR